MISIIVPVWNHLNDLTKPFVESILKCSGDFELIIVDNGSSDDTYNYLKSVFERRVKVVHSKKNLGFAGGNNLGYARAMGDRILFISNDVVINDKDFILKMDASINSNPKQLIGPMYVDYNTLTNYNYKPTPYMGGWCVYGERKLFDEIKKRDGNVWNEDFGIAYFEDVWLSVMASDLGYRLQEVAVDLVHLGSKSSDQISITETMVQAQIVFRGKMLERELKQKNQKRVVFFVPEVPYPFVDSDYEQKGVGGAEASLILLARALARKGYRVEIYNKTTVSGMFNGVYYGNVEDYIPHYYTDYFILFRSYHSALNYANAKVKLFWSCDQWTDLPFIWNKNVFPYVNATVAISPYHKQYLEEHHEPGKIEVIDLGINLVDYQVEVEKKPGKAIYCSVPDRGLHRLIKLMPLIKAKVPEFNLTITSDYRLWGSEDPLNVMYRNSADGLPYVNFVGKVPRSELVKHQLESELMVYPSNYSECFCIAAMECMAAGAVPVTIDNGALKTTVGKGGVVLSNSVSDAEYIDSVVQLLKDKYKQNKLRQKALTIGKNHDWNIIVNQWVELFNKEETMPTKRKVAKAPAVKKPIAELPKEIRLPFKRPVECAINAMNFKSVPEGGLHIVTAPSDYANTIVQNILEAYGPDII